MAGIRAYKLAEELGIDRAEFVERAKAVGIELKSAMATVDDNESELLRTKLGGTPARRDSMEERRVESKRGSTVIRRRKREPEPVPEPEPIVQPAAAAETAELELEAAAADVVETEPGVTEPPAEEEAAQPAAAEAPAQQPAAAATTAPRTAEQPTAPATPADRKGRQRKRVREVVNLREQEQFARQIVSRGGPHRRPPAVVSRDSVSPRRKRRDAPAQKAVRPVAASAAKKIVKIQGETSVGELAKLFGVKAAQIQGKLMALGTMVSVNQLVDIETINNLASDMGLEVQDVGFKEDQFIDAVAEDTPEDEGIRSPRPPIITVMGHVDHGKTSLLDAIRKTRVVEGEAGGITQHIGAYQVDRDGGRLTFIDTPGHAAFTAMRARGAQATDLVVLVVAATDGVMPQTIEAIEHARAAGCPIVVAINKCDMPGADPGQTRQRLMEHDLVPEDFGGDTICVNVSAVTGEGLDQLLEMLALQSEVLELRADSTRRARGVVLEARVDKGRGVVATGLVQDGTLLQGDIVVAGTSWGRVRVMENDLGHRVKEAGPSMPVQIIGFNEVPEAGGVFDAVENERAAKQIISHREDQARGQVQAPKPVVSLEEFFRQAEGDGPKELRVVLKSDVHGTSEAVKDALEKLSTDAVSLRVIASGVGAVGENDVTLASASDAIVVGFHVRPDPAARRLADSQGVDIRSYRVIYELIDEVKAAMAGLLPPTIKETALGRAEVRDTFVIPRQGTIAGCLVTEGIVRRGANCRLVRDGVQIYEGKVGSLRRFKDDAREVQSGTECGIGIEGYNDVKVGDAIEVFEVEEEAATL